MENDDINSILVRKTSLLGHKLRGLYIHVTDEDSVENAQKMNSA
jgi:hypothetical protein